MGGPEHGGRGRGRSRQAGGSQGPGSGGRWGGAGTVRVGAVGKGKAVPRGLPGIWVNSGLSGGAVLGKMRVSMKPEAPRAAGWGATAVASQPPRAEDLRRAGDVGTVGRGGTVGLA